MVYDRFSLYFQVPHPSSGHRTLPLSKDIPFRSNLHECRSFLIGNAKPPSRLPPFLSFLGQRNAMHVALVSTDMHHLPIMRALVLVFQNKATAAFFSPLSSRRSAGKCQLSPAIPPCQRCHSPALRCRCLSSPRANAAILQRCTAILCHFAGIPAMARNA